jgi:hypothetical protein
VSVLLAALVLGSGLHGFVTRGPITPVCTVGVPCNAPAIGAVLVFLTHGPRHDARPHWVGGRYWSGSRPAYYTVTVSPMPRIGFGIRPSRVHSRAVSTHASISRSTAGSDEPPRIAVSPA